MAFFLENGNKKSFAVLESQIPEANFLYTTKTVYNEIAFLEWQAEAADSYIDDGVDTFIINNGKIVIQTMHYTVKDRENNPNPRIFCRHFSAASGNKFQSSYNNS